MHIVDGVEWSVGYASCTLTVVEQNYAQNEQEALGIVFGVKWFNQYLYGCKFTLATVSLYTVWTNRWSMPISCCPHATVGTDP